MREMPDILWLEEIRKEDISAVGGKGASLGEMSAIGLPVPRAFVVTSHAFRQFLVESGLEKPSLPTSRDWTSKTAVNWRELQKMPSKLS